MKQDSNDAQSQQWRMSILFYGTTGVVILEWLMLELLRTPYCPPDDMLTFLGQEKYALVTGMVCLGSAWIVALVWIVTTSHLSSQDYLRFTVLIAVLLAGFLYILKYQHRPVTPWEMLWM